MQYVKKSKRKDAGVNQWKRCLISHTLEVWTLLFRKVSSDNLCQNRSRACCLLASFALLFPLSVYNLSAYNAPGKEVFQGVYHVKDRYEIMLHTYFQSDDVIVPCPIRYPNFGMFVSPWVISSYVNIHQFLYQATIEYHASCSLTSML
jgi:hypothetical protein